MTIALLLAAPVDAPFLDLASGAPAEMLHNTMAVAKGLFLFFVAVGLGLEAFGKPPTATKDYANCLWRGVIVLTLLLWYPSIFGSVLNMVSDVARRVTPENAIGSFAQQIQEAQASAYAPSPEELREATAIANDGADASGVPAVGSGVVARVVGGSLFDGLMALLITIGQIVHRVLRIISLLLVAMFYVLGPLALVASIPAISGVGTRWFGYLLTVATWPIFSGIFLALAMTLGVHRAYGAGTLGSMSAALVAVLTALATPLVASAVVGQSAASFAAHGARTAAAFATKGGALLGPAAASLSRRFGGAAPGPTGASSTGATSSASSSRPAVNPVGDGR